MEFLKGFCSFLAGLLGLYSTVILVRIIIAWMLMFSRRNGWRSGNGGYGFNQEDPNHPSGMAAADNVLGKICDPYLKLFRGVTSLRRANIDLTPVLALVVLNLARSILSVFAQVGSLTLWAVLAIIINGLWSSFGSFLLFILIVLLIVRFFLGRSRSSTSSNFIDALDPILEAPVKKVYRLFFNRKNVDEQKLILTAAIAYIVLFVALKWAVGVLVGFLISL
ncbi:MAG: YggT family protein [Sphaerochaeta sp.]